MAAMPSLTYATEVLVSHYKRRKTDRRKKLGRKKYPSDLKYRATIDTRLSKEEMAELRDLARQHNLASIDLTTIFIRLGMRWARSEVGRNFLQPKPK